jgi:hypothetical protein
MHLQVPSLEIFKEYILKIYLKSVARWTKNIFFCFRWAGINIVFGPKYRPLVQALMFRDLLYLIY